MRLFNMFFHERLYKCYSSISIVVIVVLLFSSCSSSKSTSMAYMDDIYFNTFGVIEEEVPELEIKEEEGEPPANVPGAAYVYQPIPEPSIDTETQTYNSVLYEGNDVGIPVDGFYGSDFNDLNSYSPFMSSFSFGLSFSFFFGSPYGYNNPYSYSNPFGGYGSTYNYSCPSQSGGSSSDFITKRFSWNDNGPENIQYLDKIANSLQGINNNVRVSKSRKATHTNSNSSETSSESKWSKFIKTLSENSSNLGSDTSTKSTTRTKSSSKSTTSPTRSSSSSSGSRSSGSRSSGSSKSDIGKRIR